MIGARGILARARVCATVLISGPAVAGSLAAQELPLDSLLNVRVSAAARYEQTVAEAPASVTIITAGDIRRYGYRTLGDVLHRVPGLYTSDDRNYSYLGVRGFSRPTDYNNRVLLLMDGHVINEGVFGSAAIGRDWGLDPDLIERVEVVQGPGSALYGTGAMLVSINIVSKDGAGLNGAQGSVGLGSRGLRQGVVAAGAVVGRGIDVSVGGQWTTRDGADLYYPEYDDPATNNGVAQGLDWERHRGIRARVATGRWAVTAQAASYAKGVPTGAYDVVFNDPRSQTIDEYRFLELRYRTPVTAPLALEARSFAHYYGYWGSYPYDQLTRDASISSAAGFDGQVRWDIRSGHRLLAGLSYQRHGRASYAYWGQDTSFYDRDVPFSVASAFVQDELQLARRVALVVGLRRDRYARFPATTTPRAAVVFNATPTITVKGLYGEAFRAPNVFETYYEDPISGVKRSSGLRAERITTQELVWEQRVRGTIYATLSGFRYQMRDLIDTRLDPADSLLQFQNTARARAAGLGLAVSRRLASGPAGYLNYAYQVAEDVGTGSPLTNAPRHVAGAGLTVPAGSRVVVGGEARYESPRVTVQDTRTDGFVWTRLHVLVALVRPAGRGMPDVELSAAVDNVFDTAYATPGGFEHRQAEIAQDGRTVSVRLRVLW